MNWNKSDQEMFRAVPPSVASEGRSMNTAFTEGIDAGISYCNTFTQIPNDIETIFFRDIDDHIDRHMQETDGYIGEFPDPVFKVKETTTHFYNGKSYESGGSLKMDYFKGWRYLPKDALWDSVVSERYPGGRLFEAMRPSPCIDMSDCVFYGPMLKIMENIQKSWI